jgi:hypothetical protein
MVSYAVGGERVAKRSSDGKMDVLLVDADNHLQADVVSSALPADAATHTGQDEINTNIEIISDTVSSNKVRTSLPVEQAAAFETITVTNAHAESLTSATYGSSTKAFISVAQNSVRVRWDGVAPTTSIGHLCEIGAMIELSGHDITHFQAIAVGTDSILSVTYSTEI